MAIDAAIAAAGRPEERRTVQVQLPTGRVVVLNLPLDVNAEELLALSGYIGSKLPVTLAEARAPRPRLFLPTT